MTTPKLLPAMNRLAPLQDMGSTFLARAATVHHTIKSAVTIHYVIK